MNEKILYELMDAHNHCSELFHIAYKLNGDEDTRTAFSQKTTTYMPCVLQTLSFLIDNFEEQLKT